MVTPELAPRTSHGTVSNGVCLTGQKPSPPCLRPSPRHGHRIMGKRTMKPRNMESGDKGKAGKQSESSAPEAAVSPPDHPFLFGRPPDEPCPSRPQWTAWTAEEQSALEKALKSVGKDWDKVAELVEGRSAKECKTRFKELAKAIKRARQIGLLPYIVR